MARKPSSIEYYVSNKDMLIELKKYNEENIISNELGIMLRKIAIRYSTRPCFSGYSYKEEMIDSSVERMIEQIDSFNIEKGKNPFAYFTQIVHNQFLCILNEEKKQHLTKERYRNKVYDDMCENGLIDQGYVNNENSNF